MVFDMFELVDKTYPKTLSIISEHRRKCDRAEQTEEGARDAQSRLEKSRVTGKRQAPTVDGLIAEVNEAEAAEAGAAAAEERAEPQRRRAAAPRDSRGPWQERSAGGRSPWPCKL